MEGSKLNVWRGKVSDFAFKVDSGVDLFEMRDEAGWYFSFMNEGKTRLESVSGCVVIEYERDTNFFEKVQICVDNDRRYMAELKNKSRCVEIEEEHDDSLRPVRSNR